MTDVSIFSVQVSVGGFGFICINITLPVCRTAVDINVKHPMLRDRELAEVVDGAKVCNDSFLNHFNIVTIASFVIVTVASFTLVGTQNIP